MKVIGVLVQIDKDSCVEGVNEIEDRYLRVQREDSNTAVWYELSADGRLYLKELYAAQLLEATYQKLKTS
jgi:hypothetical protein